MGTSRDRDKMTWISREIYHSYMVGRTLTYTWVNTRPGRTPVKISGHRDKDELNRTMERLPLYAWGTPRLGDPTPVRDRIEDKMNAL